jgi:hypothetical protein
MKLFLAVFGIAILVASASAFQGIKSRPIDFPGVAQGSLSDEDERMPKSVDAGAKGGPSDPYTFTLSKPTRFYALLECDSCLPRLVLTGPDEAVNKRASGLTTTTLKVDLDTGTYVLRAASDNGWGGDYERPSATLRSSQSSPSFPTSP